MTFETRNERGLSKSGIGGKKDSSLRSPLAPLQRGRQLERIRSAQIIAVHELNCRRSECIGRLDHSPGIGNNLGKLSRLSVFLKPHLLNPHQSS